MPKCIRQYADKNKARLYRNRQRSKNYDRTTEVTQSGKPWSIEDIEWLCIWSGTDADLSEFIQRSVRGIQKKRFSLKVKKIKL